MAGPAPQERKHGRTPNTLSNGEWREYPDVPFTGAPEMPKPPGKRRAWDDLAVEMWQKASVMPHCKDWRPEDWLNLRILITEVDLYYRTTDAKKKTAQLTEIRRQMNALGIGEAGRRAQKILYKQKVEPGRAGDGPDGAIELITEGGPTKAAGNVVPIKTRRAAILGRGAGGGQAETATG